MSLSNLSVSEANMTDIGANLSSLCSYMQGKFCFLNSSYKLTNYWSINVYNI